MHGSEQITETKENAKPLLLLIARLFVVQVMVFAVARLLTAWILWGTRWPSVLPPALTGLAGLLVLWRYRGTIQHRLPWQWKDLKNPPVWAAAVCVAGLTILLESMGLGTTGVSVLHFLSWVQFLILGAAVVVMNPFLDEWLYRGIVQPYLTRRLSPWLAIVLTASLSAVLSPGHDGAVTFLYGVVAGYLVHWRQGLAVAVLAHALHRLGSLALMAFPLGLHT